MEQMVFVVAVTNPLPYFSCDFSVRSLLEEEEVHVCLDPGLELPSARHLTHGIAVFTHLKPSKYNISGKNQNRRENKTI